MSIVCLSWIDPTSKRQRRERFSLPLLIGRDLVNDLVLPDAQVSRRHALLRQVRERVVITDLASRNGLWVDGQRVEQAPISDDAIIQLGATTLKVALDAMPSEAVPAELEAIPPIIGAQSAVDIPAIPQIKRHISHIARSPQGDLLALACAGGIQLYHGPKAEKLHFVPIGQPLVHMAVADDGAVLVLAAGQQLEYWRIQPHMTHHLHIQGSFAQHMALDAVGTILALDRGESVQILRLIDGAVLQTLPIDTAGSGGALALAPDGQLLAAAVAEGIQLWDVAHGKLLRQIALDGTTVQSLNFAPDGQRLLIATHGAVSAWEVRKARHLWTNDGLGQQMCVAVASDGRRVAVASDHLVRIWRLGDGALLQHIGYTNDLVDLVFGTGGETLAVATPEDVYIWRTRDAALVATL